MKSCKLQFAPIDISSSTRDLAPLANAIMHTVNVHINTSSNNNLLRTPKYKIYLTLDTKGTYFIYRPYDIHYRLIFNNSN
ncbi:hypothetical protein Fmac_025409 [Flemingia macrophylla]|uniref:Uncharacterized protein n=1 Tax=Flemingia macrophylla TaxID=520843 RepID=A0ABD1LS47_9FABA